MITQAEIKEICRKIFLHFNLKIYGQHMRLWYMYLSHMRKIRHCVASQCNDMSKVLSAPSFISREGSSETVCGYENTINMKL